jgi:hypothetical protein
MVPLFYDEEETIIYCYYDHPRKHIPTNCLDWHLEYEYYKDFGGAPSFDECSLRFLEAKQVYESYLRHWNSRENNKGQS